ncbi:MAG TPA: hypothetical protein PLP83_01305 [Candidatus Aminicenantes bacterium]|nr:hypothetical protein [Candidatus Aminicenantes bacterium]
MKKLAMLVLAGLVLATVTATFAMSPRVNDQSLCNKNHLECREFALNLDEPWYKVALMLTVCDIAFGKCALGL